MSETEEPSVQTARINSRQAIVVAAITGVVSIVSTLIATGVLRRDTGEADPALQGGNQAVQSAAMKAPHVGFNAKKLEMDVGPCLEQARSALKLADFRGIESNPTVAWAYSGAYIGAVWCDTPDSLVIFIAAGRDDGEARQTAQAIRRNF